jgi:hypothetical protein
MPIDAAAIAGLAFYEPFLQQLLHFLFGMRSRVCSVFTHHGSASSRFLPRFGPIFMHPTAVAFQSVGATVRVGEISSHGGKVSYESHQPRKSLARPSTLIARAEYALCDSSAHEKSARIGQFWADRIRQLSDTQGGFKSIGCAHVVARPTTWFCLRMRARRFWTFWLWLGFERVRGELLER